MLLQGAKQVLAEYDIPGNDFVEIARLSSQHLALITV